MAKKKGRKKIIAFFIILILAVLIISIIAVSYSFNLIGGRIAVIDIKGEIVPTTGLFIGGASPSDIIPLLEQAEAYDGVLIRIDSPGGTVVASKSIADAVKSMSKPTVCLLGDIAASGAYWIASSCDYIVSDPLTATGSIGATASYLEYTGFMEKYGIGYERFVSGGFKDTGSPFRELTDDERKKFQKLIDDVGNYFLQDVVENRGLTKEQVDKIMEADIFLGDEALDLGLVDELGGVKEAEKALEELTGLTDPLYVELAAAGFSLF